MVAVRALVAGEAAAGFVCHLGEQESAAQSG
jgi:hypothetical protein